MSEIYDTELVSKVEARRNITGEIMLIFMLELSGKVASIIEEGVFQHNNEFYKVCRVESIPSSELSVRLHCQRTAEPTGQE